MFVFIVRRTGHVKLRKYKFCDKWLLRIAYNAPWNGNLKLCNGENILKVLQGVQKTDDLRNP